MLIIKYKFNSINCINCINYYIYKYKILYFIMIDDKLTKILDQPVFAV